MTWITTVPFEKADERLRKAIEAQRALYPAEYATPAFPGQQPGEGIVAVAQPDPRRRSTTRSRPSAR